MDGSTFEVLRAGLTAIVGVFLLSSAVQGWFIGARVVWFLRILLTIAALTMIEGGLMTDLIGVGLGAAAFAIQRMLKPKGDLVPTQGAD